MKRWIAWILVLTCVFCMIPSCSKNETGGEGTPAPTELTLIENGATQYQIVYSIKDGTWATRFAIALRDTIEDVTGVKIPTARLTVPLGEATDGRKATEIIVGGLDLLGEMSELEKANYKNGYAIRVENEKILFAVDSGAGAYYALCRFAADFLGVDLQNGEATLNPEFTKLSVPTSYSQADRFSSSVIPAFDKDAESIVVAYRDDEIQKRMAIRLREQLRLLNNDSLDLFWIVYDEDEIPDTDAAILIEEDESLVNGTWRISLEGKRLHVAAGDYNGFVSALRELKTRESSWDFVDLNGFTEEQGSYLDSIKKSSEQTSVYAYEKQGEYRVIFYNALHHNGTGTRPNQSNDVPVAERNRLQTAMIEVWNPDVLALQEMPLSKRDGAGNNSLITLLGALGYVETVDPRVKNMVSREDGGYGIGGTKVTVGDETFYTHFNCVPLLYNTNTTRCLESEYFWFPSQEDENTGELGAGECASKATTWGVFESIETGERYIVVSGHFRGMESVQLNQAKEIAAEIAKLVAKYDCPVFLGGDFNGHVSNAFYAYLTEELDYVSMQDSKIAKQYTSPVRTTHGYPRFDESIGIMTDGGQAVSHITDQNNGDSIDKVFVSNYENASLEIFGVIADECSLSASDHLPMVVDFSIQSKPIG